MNAEAKGPQMIRRGDVRAIRELKRGVQAQVCLGSSVVHGSAVLTLETASPRVMKALDELRDALRQDALNLYQLIQNDD